LLQSGLFFYCSLIIFYYVFVFNSPFCESEIASSLTLLAMTGYWLTLLAMTERGF